MPNLCLETIKVEDGRICNIEWHNQRCNQTRLALFGLKTPLLLQNYITPPPTLGIFRCRILYNQTILSVEYIPYRTSLAKSFKIMQSKIEYKYKYADRDALNTLKEEALSYDEIIIEKEGLLTDTSIANIAFYSGEQWITPEKPLLKGTIREKLIKNGFLTPKSIKIGDLKAFSNFALMNAMIGFQIQNNITIYIDKKEKICL